MGLEFESMYNNFIVNGESQGFFFFVCGWLF